jgi:hypothetical protein
MYCFVAEAKEYKNIPQRRRETWYKINVSIFLYKNNNKKPLLFR